MKSVAIVVLAIAVAVAAALLWLRFGARGFSARQDPSRFEKWIAGAARSAAASSQARSLKNPVASTPAVLADARAHWADHCAICHANDGSGSAEMGHNMYPRAPDMRSQDTQALSDGELFFIIENGIRLSGMPAWSGDHSAMDSWKLVHFIRHLPALQPEELREMERLNPKSAEELEEERFLKGETTK